MGRTITEGSATVRISKKNLNDWINLQDALIQKGIMTPSEQQLQNLLGVYSTGLGIIAGYFANPIVGIATTAVTLAPYFTINEKAVLQSEVSNGTNWLNQQVRWMDANPKYDQIEIKYPYIQYGLSDGSYIRFCTGLGVVTSVHGSGGWVVN